MQNIDSKDLAWNQTQNKTLFNDGILFFVCVFLRAQSDGESVFLFCSRSADSLSDGNGIHQRLL